MKKEEAENLAEVNVSGKFSSDHQKGESLSLYMCLLVCSKEETIIVTYTDDDDDPSWISAGFCFCFFIFHLLTFLRNLN